MTGFTSLVTRRFASLMQPGNAADPLLRQVLECGEELAEVPGFGADPVGDQGAMQDCGILQKYQGRVLLMTTGACAVHCRYCFRREFPYADIQSVTLAPRLSAYLRKHPEVQEVILSGGDPLLLADEGLEALLEAAQSSREVKRVRIHTRLPVVLPSRFDAGLSKVLGRVRVPLVLVSHVNHPNELDVHSAQVFQGLHALGVHLLNQAVLLRGVNDLVPTLQLLSERLFAQGVLPYYLHQLDRVRGAAHFEVSDGEALQLMEGLQRNLPGYLVPKLVREIAGEPGKTWLR